MNENEVNADKSIVVVVLAGLAVLLVTFLVTVFFFHGSDNPGETIPAVLGAVTGVLGTLVGYVAGQQGKQKSDAKASNAEQRLTAVVSEGNKDALKQAWDKYPELFKNP